MSKLISQLPEDIKAVALQRQREETSNVWHKKTTSLANAFNWDSTIEGEEIWSDVEEGNYTPFREFHAKLKQPETNGWISVEERLPEDCIKVLLYTESEGVKYGHYSKLLNQWYSEWHNQILPTHWQPLPPPPAKP